jgi:hypothetical protein
MNERSLSLMVDARTVHPYSSSFEAIRKQLSSLQPGRRRELAKVTEAALRSSVRRDEKARVGRVKILVALLPESLTAITSLLRASTGSMHEVHFSLFCFLDRAQSIRTHTSLRRRVLREVAAYLRNVKSDPALAAWMGGDLLGEHWAPRDAWPVLMRLARTARHPAGRIAAVHGLRHALPRATGKVRRDLSRVLNEIAVRDASRAVRSAAKVALASTIAI